MKQRRRLDVSAAAEPTTVNLVGTVEFVAAAAPKDGEPPARPRFAIAAYTGAPVNLGNFHYPVILDLSGMKMGRAKIPILRDHDPSRIVGMTDSDSIDASGVRLNGMVTGDNADGAEVVSQAKNGFEWQASVGANITRREFLEAGKKAQVNGREVQGPMIIARESLLLETSFVAIGADHQTSASVAATHSPRKAADMDPKFTAWLEAKGWDGATLSDDLISTLQASFKAETGNKPRLKVDDVLLEAQREEQRRQDIADLTAQFLADNPGGGQELLTKVQLLVEAANDGKWSKEKFDTELLRASRPAPFRGYVGGGKSGNRITNDVLSAAVCQAGRLPDYEKQFDDQTLQAAHTQFRNGIGLKQIFLICAEANGYRGSYASDVNLDVQRAAFGMTAPNRVQVQAQGWSALDIATTLSNTANKFLRVGWMGVDMTPMRISKITSVRDFKQIMTASLTGDLQFEKIGTAGEIKHGTLGETTYTNQADTYAKMLAITRQDIINDDLNALTTVPQRLGRGAALKLNDIFWTLWMGLEAAGFFASGNSNLNTGVADMTVGGLAATEAIFLNQTDPNSKPLGVQPAIILCPTALKAAAMTLMQSELLITGSDLTRGATNIFRGRFRVESSPYMSNSSYTGYSASEWYLLADPNELPAVEIVALNGRVEPVVETADADFNTLGVQMRGYSDVGVKEQEYRAAVEADGGTS